MLALAVLSIPVFTAFRHKLPDTAGSVELKTIERTIVYIPSGNLTVGNSDSDQPPTLPTNLKVEPAPKTKTMEIPGFHLSSIEVTNHMYLQFLATLQHDPETYKAMLPDTLVWLDGLGYNEPYRDYYLRHPAYRTYPVVGVTREQALAWCNWLTNWYNKQPKREHQRVRFTLPNKTQWEYAARGGHQYAAFPWGGPYMQNAKGQWLANFKRVSQGSIAFVECDDEPATTHLQVVPGAGTYVGIAGSLNENANILAPVNAYAPNDFGLYNMAGNAAEFVQEPGITKGGSWTDTSYYLQNSVVQTYPDSAAASKSRGFRFMMEVLEE